MRILVFGGGFGGVATVRHLERYVWANRRIESLTCRRVYKQQEAETEGGEQAGETRAVVEGLGNHRFRSHREQCSGSKCLQPRWPRLMSEPNPTYPATMATAAPMAIALQIRKM